MTTGAIDIWSLVLDRTQVDPDDLAASLDAVARLPSMDFRTQLLVRDSLRALQRHRGAVWVETWLRDPGRAALKQILNADLGEPGFPTLEQRIMDKTRSTTVEQFLRELGTALQQKTSINVGGSIALIMMGMLERRTDDIDVVDEVPADIRVRHDLLDDLAKRYGLRVTHFQSHYLPHGWQSRLRSLGSFGRLDVFLVDVYDVFVGKLFSNRGKDLDDLRMLLPQLDCGRIAQHIGNTATSFLADAQLRAAAERNWYVLFGEMLPA